MHRLKHFRPSPALAVATIALVTALGGVAVATIPGGDGVIHSCYANDTGAMRVIDQDQGQACDPNSETALDFNQQGLPGDPGPPGPTASAYAEGQNNFTYVNSGNYITSVELIGPGGPGPITVSFPAQLHIIGEVRLRNHDGNNGDYDRSECRPQVGSNFGGYQDAGQPMEADTLGYTSRDNETSIPVNGMLSVQPGTYNVRLVCRRIASSGVANQNKFDGNSLNVIAVANQSAQSAKRNTNRSQRTAPR